MREYHREVRDRFNFLVERLLVRGALYRLLLIAAAIGLVSVLGASLVAHTGSFASFKEAVWWAFLRLTDPGYLGDDVGLWRRTVSTVLTVLGYVIFLGALVAILTQWLNATLERLSLGLTPITMRDHIVILGWTNRIRGIVQNLVQSEGNVERWLARQGVRTLRIAILVDRVTPAHDQDLRDWLGSDYRRDRIILRSGTPLKIEHLRRVDFARAAAVVLPGEEVDAAEDDLHDARVLKALLTIATRAEVEGEDGEMPTFVAEMFERGRLGAARRAYGGKLEVVASNKLIGELLANEVLQPGLARIYGELLTHGVGQTLQIRDEPHLAGKNLRDVQRWFPRARVLGLVRPRGKSFSALLNAPDESLEPGDRLIMMAASYNEAAPSEKARNPCRPLPVEVDGRLPPPSGEARRILVVGWNRKAPHVLSELALHGSPPPSVVVLSRLPIPERLEALETTTAKLGGLRVEHIEGDPTLGQVLRRVGVHRFDAVLFLANDWLDRNEDADARTIASFLMFSGLAKKMEHVPQAIIELLDGENAELLEERETAGEVEVVVSTRMLAHILGQVVLRRELRAAIEALLGGGDGSELRFLDAQIVRLGDGTEASFEQIAELAARLGCSALGIYLEDDEQPYRLNPAGEERFVLSPRDSIIVLAPETAVLLESHDALQDALGATQ